MSLAGPSSCDLLRYVAEARLPSGRGFRCGGDRPASGWNLRPFHGLARSPAGVLLTTANIPRARLDIERSKDADRIFFIAVGCRSSGLFVRVPNVCWGRDGMSDEDAILFQKREWVGYCTARCRVFAVALSRRVNSVRRFSAAAPVLPTQTRRAERSGAVSCYNTRYS